ncbi:Holliday junction resolvase RuvX [Patescibacteria group bacterium]|jgi:putative Holliday junction resolvase|nr:Holliday junction resolvase RuvX [Patescibacteria group bacterium]
MRILGLDYGSARIGVALGDPITRVASPWKIITNDSFEDVLVRLRDLVQHESVSKIVVGIPRPLGDQERETDQAKEIRSFISKLKAEGFDVEEENETWTSKIAADQVKEMGERGKRDDLAAAAILQQYLDKLA